MLSPNQKAMVTEQALRLKFAVQDVRGSCFRLSTHAQKLKNEKAGSGSGSPLERKTKVDPIWGNPRMSTPSPISNDEEKSEAKLELLTQSMA